MNKNKKALAVMLGTLVFLLVLAVVLLSVIIVSLAKEDDPALTNLPKLTQTRVPEQTTGTPAITDHVVPEQTTQNPETTKPVVNTDPVPTSGDVTTDLPETTEKAPTTTQPAVTTKPASNVPNVPVGGVVEVENSDGSIVRSGSFRDNGSTALHLMIEWEARYASRDATTANLTVRVYLQSYSIGISARDNGMLTIGGEGTSFQTPSIYYSKNEPHRTLLTARSLTVTKSSASDRTEVDLSAAWNYRGTYSGVHIDWLSVAGTIEV